MTRNPEETDSSITLPMQAETTHFQNSNNMVRPDNKNNNKVSNPEADKADMAIKISNKATIHSTELRLTRNEGELFLRP